MESRKISILIDGKPAHTFERSKGNEIKEIKVLIDGVNLETKAKLEGFNEGYFKGISDSSKRMSLSEKESLKYAKEMLKKRKKLQEE